MHLVIPTHIYLLWAFFSLIWSMSLFILCPWAAGAFAVPLHCFCYDIVYSYFFLLLLLELRAETPTMPISHIIPSLVFIA